ncbi:hypothetical protein GQ457_08G031280 [Hibiscus cannabinus]
MKKISSKDVHVSILKHSTMEEWLLEILEQNDHVPRKNSNNLLNELEPYLELVQRKLGPLNEATTPSASSFQLISAPFSSTSATLAQLKLNNPEVVENRPACGTVTYECVAALPRREFAYNIPRSVTIEETTKLLIFSSCDVSTSSSAHVADPEVLPQGPATRSKAKQFREVHSLTCAKLLDSFDNVCALERERTCALELKSSSVEAWKLVCSSFQLNEATTPSTSSFQLNSAPSNSTSAPLAQLKLNSQEVAESVLRQVETVLREGRVSRDMCHAHGQLVSFLDEDAANSSNFMAAIEALLKPSSSFHFESFFSEYAYSNSGIETK